MKEDAMLRVALAQISPVWLDKRATLDKILDYIREAGEARSDLVVFGEGLLPGYPFWLSYTQGAEFDSPIQKEIYAHYVRESVQIDKGDLREICDLAKTYTISIYLGIIERAADRGGHSLYCSLVYINQLGEIASVHRKLQPTYEERLVWAQGDGHGLKVHPLKQFTVGGLNCWENWMPLTRTALYGQGENLHVAVWPGTDKNTGDITRFIARESRSFVLSVSGLMKPTDISSTVPHRDMIIAKSPAVLANGGSCIASPNGEWLIPPVLDKEGLITAELDINRVFEERQNFDPTGHYSRPDVLKLHVDGSRQSAVTIE